MKTFAVLSVLCLARLAAADGRTITLDRICVETDSAVDALAPADRQYAETVLRRVLERENQLVVTGACTETYRLSHERVDDTYVIRIGNPTGRRRMKAATLDELYVKYQRMVRSLLAAKATAHDPIAPEAAAPADVTDSLQNDSQPMLQQANDLDPFAEQPQVKPSMWYALLGFQFTGGPTLTGGYRVRLPSVLLDFAAAARGAELHGFTLGMKVLMDKPVAETSLYGGGGLSFGAFARGEEYTGNYYTGGGVHAELTGGIRFPAGTHQGMIQLDVTLPFYQLSNDETGITSYGATASLTGGIGW
jgi:hypothetical protein